MENLNNILISDNCRYVDDIIYRLSNSKRLTLEKGQPFLINDSSYYTDFGYRYPIEQNKFYSLIAYILDKNSILSIPDKNISSIYFFILQGKCNFITCYNGSIMSIEKKENDTYKISKDVSCRIENRYHDDCHLIELAYYL